jgi:hypothetical protein
MPMKRAFSVPTKLASSTVVADNGTPPDVLPPATCTTTTAGDKSLICRKVLCSSAPGHSYVAGVEPG